MAETFKASISVQIGDGSSSKSAAAEIDTRSAEDGGENAMKLGKTSGFQAGEDVYVLLHLPDGVVYDKKNLGCYVHHNYEDERSAEFRCEWRITTYTVSEELQFDGSSRTANLSKIARPGTLKVCGWRGDNLVKYYGDGNLELSGDRSAVLLPKIPTNMYPKTPDNAAVDVLKTAAIEFKKKTSRMGVVGVKYQVEALVFKIKLPNQKALDNFGRPPYPFIATIYCVEDAADDC